MRNNSFRTRKEEQFAHPSELHIPNLQYRAELAATSSPARVRSTVSSRSISARLAITWEKNRTDAVPVSIASVETSELNAWPVQFSTQVHQILNAAAEPIKLPGDQGVSFAQRIPALWSGRGRSARLPLSPRRSSYSRPWSGLQFAAQDSDPGQ